MKLAVTGANGFIGRHVVAEALRQGHDVIAITRKAKEPFLASFLVDHHKSNISSLDVKECNLNDKKTLNQSLHECDAVIHLAASMDSTDADNQYQQTLDTTKKVIESVNHNNIKTLILVSSISVLDYVNQKANTTIDEKTPRCDRDDEIGNYAKMKRDQERLCQQWQLETGKQLIIIRPGLVYSSEQLSDAHAGFIKKAMGITAFHNGEVPLIEVAHVAEKMISLFGQTLFSKDIFHLIGTPPVSQTDYLEQLKQQGQLQFSLPLPWQTYRLLTKVVGWLLIKANKQHKIPDSFRANSVAARQKPFKFSSEKINDFIK